MSWLLTGLALAAPNLVLISLDTTRADALSCYGRPAVEIQDAAPQRPRTPVLDSLADEGLRFQSFFAQSPTTLASHATLFTGRGPHGHDVVRNGFPVRAGLPTLASRLQEEGYTTWAVLGAAALESGSGIERGFQIYDDKAPTLSGLMYQSPAPEVVQRALALTEEPPDTPLFLFVHFFDAHSPYNPPSPARERFAVPIYHGPFNDPDAKLLPLVRQLHSGPSDAVSAVNGRYYGEVSAIDVQVGLLLDGLTARGLLDEAVVVVVGDHGESLSDDGKYAWTHGSTVTDGVTRVPLLIRAYGDVPIAQHAVIQSQASMEQVAPTLEQALGLPPTLGHGFWDLIRPGPVFDSDGWPERPTPPIFQEATRPRGREHKTEWNNLPFARSVRVGRHSLVKSPSGNYRRTALSPVFLELLSRWDSEAPPHQTAALPDHTRRALIALGYIDP